MQVFSQKLIPPSSHGCVQIHAQNFSLVDEIVSILVVVIVSESDFSFSFRLVDENYRIFVVVIVITRRKLFYLCQRKFSFSSSSMEEHLLEKLANPINCHLFTHFDATIVAHEIIFVDKMPRIHNMCRLMALLICRTTCKSPSTYITLLPQVLQQY